MGNEIIVFSPAKTVTKIQLSRRLIFKLGSYSIFIVIDFYVLGEYYWPFLVTLGVLTLAFYPLIFKRYPTKIFVNKNNHLLKVNYLDFLGKEKEVVINIDKAVISYGRDGAFGGNANYLLIYDNYFTNSIRIDQSSEIYTDQIMELGTLLKDLRKEKRDFLKS